MAKMTIVSSFLRRCRFNCAGTARALALALWLPILFSTPQAGGAGVKPASAASGAAQARQSTRPGAVVPPGPSEGRAEDHNTPARVNDLPENGRPVPFEADEGT